MPAGKDLNLTVKQIRKAGFPYEMAYKYSKMNDENRKSFEKAFAQRFPKIYTETIRKTIRKTIKSEIYNMVVEGLIKKSVISEGTRAQIGTVLPGGKIKHVYVHWDGYLEGVGQTLKRHYSNPALIRKLLQLGDISSLNKSIGKKHDFNDHDIAEKNGWTTFYGRDRGESGVSATASKDMEQYLDKAGQSGADYVYLFDPTKNKWIYTRGSSSGWKSV